LPLYYLDSSALIKAYLPEKGSAWIEELVVSGTIAISMLTVSEVASALSRRVREGTIDAGQRKRLFDTFLAHTDRFQVMGVSPEVIDDAAAILLRDPPSAGLRTLDAIHLATAQRSFILARQAASESGVLVAADRRLRDAAFALGTAVDNPEGHE
jgi:predicted nucleic acid-binding protein